METFRYWKDGLFLGACLAYLLNRFLIKPWCSDEFLHSHFNDVLLLPCALPLMLWLHRRLGLRRHDSIPAWTEILFHALIWSALFEWFGPMLSAHATGDWRDIVCYLAGGLGARFYWERSYARN